MSALKELREKQQKLVVEARDALNGITDKTDESRAAELESQHDKAMSEHDKLEARASKIIELEERQKRLDEPANEAPSGGTREIKPETNEINEGEVFNKFLRSGLGGLNAEQRQAMLEKRAQSTTDAEGGFTVPEGFIAQIVETMKYTGPMMNGDVIDLLETDSGNPLPMPTNDDTGNVGEIINENTQVAEQDSTFGAKTLEAFLYSSKAVRVSEALLQDTGVDLEGYLANALGTRLGRIGNTHLTTGTGSSQPNGIVTASSLGVTAASATAITFDELIDLEHSVDIAYRSGEKVGFMFNDSTLKALRKIKDGDGNYLWQAADARTGAGATLLARNYFVNNDMPALTTGNKAVIFGDLGKYMVRRVNQMPLKRLVERYADFGQVGFLQFARLDGELTDTAAVKHLITA